MPNWCYNRLEINGPKDQLEALENLVRTEENEFDFNAILPYPFKQMDDDYPAYNDPDRVEKLAAYKEKYGTELDGFNSGGYDWCWENWSTKWNASDVCWEDSSDELCVTFETAWSPPAKVIAALAEKFPELNMTLSYTEEGMAFYGKDRASNGEYVRDCIEKDSHEYQVGDYLQVKFYDEDEDDYVDFYATYVSKGEDDMINVVDEEGQDRVVSKYDVMLESYQ